MMKQLLIRVTPSNHRALRMLAAERETSVQRLATAALERLLARPGLILDIAPLEGRGHEVPATERR